MKTMDHLETFSNKFSKERRYDASGDRFFAVVLKIANYSQRSCCFKTFCYNWVNIGDVTIFHHKY